MKNHIVAFQRTNPPLFHRNSLNFMEIDIMGTHWHFRYWQWEVLRTPSHLNATWLTMGGDQAVKFPQCSRTEEYTIQYTQVASTVNHNPVWSHVTECREQEGGSQEFSFKITLWLISVNVWFVYLFFFINLWSCTEFPLWKWVVIWSTALYNPCLLPINSVILVKLA